MDVVPLDVAQQMRADGQFLIHQEVLGHVYGITATAVRKLQALGKLPLLDLDRVADVQRLREAGFQVISAVKGCFEKTILLPGDSQVTERD